MSQRALTWSYGGGTQSAAIAVLVAQGRLPRPEVAVIADTGREQQETWDYLANHVQPMLWRARRLSIQVIRHDLATVDLYSRKGDLLVPAFTSPKGMLPTYCSTEWKKRVVQRYLRLQGYGPKHPVATWIGFSTNEGSRIKPSGVDWQEYQWPLCNDVPLSREECRAVVEAAGLPTPPRSSCWMCPFHTNEEWRHIRDAAPADFAKAVAFDYEMREMDPTLYLHRSYRPLAEASLEPVISTAEREHECQTGFCFV